MKDYLISIYILALCYVIGAFINWDGNAGNWSEFSRFNVVLVWVLISVAWAVHEEKK